MFKATSRISSSSFTSFARNKSFSSTTRVEQKFSRSYSSVRTTRPTFYPQSKTSINANIGFKTARKFSSAPTVTPTPPLELKTNLDPPKDFIKTSDYFKNRKVLLIGIVGAFTGVCDNQLPPYKEKADEFKAKGVDEIAVVSVNDPAVMKAFGKYLGLDNKLTLLADFDGSFTRSLGMEVDLTAAKFGKRSKRYAMVVENGKITQQWVEEKPGDLKVSAAEKVLANL